MSPPTRSPWWRCSRNDEQLAAAKASGGASITNRATGEEGTQKDALHDMFAPYEHVYGAWGRDVDLKFVTSSGNDDDRRSGLHTLAVSAMKPFTVLDTVLTGLDVFDTVIAQKKIHVIGFATTNETAQALAPYRWGGNDRDRELGERGGVHGQAARRQEGEVRGR